MNFLKKIKRKLEKNPLDALLEKAKKENKEKFLLAWNRGLGDISLGLYAVVYRIKEYIPDAKITFIARDDLIEGFELLEGIDFISVPFWRRYMPFDIYHTLNLLKIDPNNYEVIVDNVDFSYWVKWQLSSLIPKMKWDTKYDGFCKKFELPQNKIFVGVHCIIETIHSPWRSYPKKNFQELFSKASKDIVFILFGNHSVEKFDGENIIDLRGKTKLLEVLSILKNKCSYFIALDSGILSIFYYLDVDFPIKLIALWGAKGFGVMKQNVLSPNKKMNYVSIFSEKLCNLKADRILEEIYPNDIEKILKENNQLNLLEKFKKLSVDKKINFIHDIFSIDLKVLEKQKSFFSKINKETNFEPLKNSFEASLSDYKKGQKALISKEIATIIMAAGQGTRLGFNGPKGLFKINSKSLFEHHIDKILQKQKKYNVKLFVSVMTSHLNYNEILSFFNKNSYFGLEKSQVDFFVQKKAPFIDEKGNWIYDENNILQAPDGNGSIFVSFNESCILAKYLKNKIKIISVIPVDNPLCDPFDEFLIGFHKNQKTEVTIKCIKRDDPNEKKGAIALKNNKIKIIEYIDLEKNKNYSFSNSGIYTMNIDFFKKMKDIELNYNFVLKKISNEKEIFAYKSENFIFESFDYSSKVKTLFDKKENFYAPLKDISNIKEIEKLLSLGNQNKIC